MQEGDNGVKNLTKNEVNLNITSFKETEIIRLIKALDQKIKFLENKNVAPKALNNEHCTYKDTCYTAKSKNGLCPCELYR
jgi:hypothetical protein